MNRGTNHVRRIGSRSVPFARAAVVLAALTACAGRTGVATAPGAQPVAPATAGPALAHAIIPAPVTAQLTPGAFLVVDSATRVVIDAGAGSEVERIAGVLAGLITLHPASAKAGTPGVTGARVARVVRRGPNEPSPARAIVLALAPDRSSLGNEGYELSVTRDGAMLVAREPAGLFYGVQTLRQLLPVAVEHGAALDRTLRLPVGRIVDTPRFAWRGAMLDVARHFFGPDDVKRYIDLMALYKLNRLHLHLADDQGWRIEIRSWPKLTSVGGLLEVGGGAGGYYTQAQFADLVAYARSRFIEIVPEIDMPGHVNAAVSAYPELNCAGAVPPYTGTVVGFSALCVERDTVYRFVDDVVREIAAMTPAPWYHMGGDEVQTLTHDQYARFVERVQEIVGRHGKQMIGWSEIATAALSPSSIVQHWVADSTRAHAARGGKVILSPANRIYIDMKYDSATVLGLKWAAIINLRRAYDWEPASLVPGVPESAILGVEAPLWSETLESVRDIEFMAFPRLLAVAELAWSPPAARGWDGFRGRLGAHGPRLQALGVNFYRSPEVIWAR